MTLFIDATGVLQDPGRWAAALGVAAGTRASQQLAVSNYLARQFSSVGRVLIRRRAVPERPGVERFLLRPAASAEPSANTVWVGLVCDYDAARRALRVVDRAMVQPGPPQAAERLYRGELTLETRLLAPSYCDTEAVAFLKRVPIAVELLASPTDRWRDYLDWRRKLAETKAAQAYVYVDYERRAGRTVRFFLRDPQPLEKLRMALQDEDLRAGLDARDKRAPQGVFRRARHTPPRPGVPPQGPAVDLEFEEAAWNGLRLPSQGELRVAMEGELSTLDIQLSALRRLAEGQAQNPNLRDWLFAIARVKPLSAAAAVAWEPVLPLNPEQRDAVSRALALDDLLLLWGPPGTGKTTVIAEICAQYARRGKRVLVASQANLAVEQALGRLPPHPEVRPVWISTAKRRDSAAGDVAGHARRWLGGIALAVRHGLAKAGAQAPAERVWNQFLGEWATRLEEATDADVGGEFESRYVRRANIVGATCNEAGKPDFVGSSRFSARFDLVVVDEVSKATPPELLVAMLMGRRILLVGDHRQLPPMFRDEAFDDAVENGEISAGEVEAFREIVTASLFSHYYRDAAAGVRVGLRRQYRMHPRIMDAVNAFYADRPLLPGDGAETLTRAKAHTLDGRLPTGQPWLQPGQSLLWIDTARGPEGTPIRDERVGASRRNALEADLAARLLAELAAQPGARGLSFGIISFYRSQVERIREAVRALPAGGGAVHLFRDVNTVDQFQGSERDVIFVSLVRGEGPLTGDFARDFRRINVAFSRARRLLVILGHGPTFAAAQVRVPAAGGIGDAAVRVYASIQALARSHGGWREAASFFPREAGQ